MPVGVLMGRSRWADAALQPWVSMFVVTSTAALIPLLIMLLGTGFSFRVTVMLRVGQADPLKECRTVYADLRRNVRHGGALPPCAASGVLTKSVFAKLYRIPEEGLMFFAHDTARAIKVSIPRPAIQGDRNDGDMYGGQQHAPLVTLEMSD